MTPETLGGVLCLDVGSGAQDAPCWFADRLLENCPKFVLPSRPGLARRRDFEKRVHVFRECNQ